MPEASAIVSGLLSGGQVMRHQASDHSLAHTDSVRVAIVFASWDATTGLLGGGMPLSGRQQWLQEQAV